ncbi:hypothetical protein KM043_008088 [Ampulex compressa]|nr:hypothetical protein KM043_008088 [Ampulex compressa]
MHEEGNDSRNDRQRTNGGSGELTKRRDRSGTHLAAFHSPVIPSRVLRPNGRPSVQNNVVGAALQGILRRESLERKPMVAASSEREERCRDGGERHAHAPCEYFCRRPGIMGGETEGGRVEVLKVHPGSVRIGRSTAVVGVGSL